MANSDSKNDFLRFSAYSIKDLITRKLSENSEFTDQVYEGSNLAILIDIVSYMYQCLLYQLNSAAAESMFSDTQIYENIQRLCNFIGYHPRGFTPSTLQINIYPGPSFTDGVTRYIFGGTRLDTGMTDSRGNKIYFSFDWDQQQERLSNGGVTRLTLTNGTWKIYNSTFTATGNDYETFVLGGIEKDDNGNTLVANGKIRVIVKPKGSEQFDTDWYFDENELFIQAFDSQKSQQSSQIISNSKIYDSDNKVYSVYLNSNKDWEIKFGNGVLGRKLNPGDEVYVIYLETNGEEGYIDMDKLGRDSVKLEFDPSMFGVNEETLCNMMKVKNFNSSITTEASGGEDGYEVEVIMDSLSIPKKQDDVTEIRENAPNWFKTGNRLITKKDYEYYIRQNTILSEVIDVKCMNNWDYMTTFYRWLYNLGLHPIDEYNVVLAQRGEQQLAPDGYRYLNPSRILQGGYQYVDSADANNIYLWIKCSQSNTGSTSLKARIDPLIQNIKTMTSETYPLNPIDVYFDISFTPIDLYLENIRNPDYDQEFSYLEITMQDNGIYSNTAVTNQIVQIINDEFSIRKCYLGQSIKSQDILNRIFQINGVERVRTVFYPQSDFVRNQYGARYCDGISFASWTNAPDIVNDIGVDLTIGNTIRQMEQFQFPVYLPTSNIRNKIKVIKKTMNTTNPVRF